MENKKNLIGKKRKRSLKEGSNSDESEDESEDDGNMIGQFDMFPRNGNQGLVEGLPLKTGLPHNPDIISATMMKHPMPMIFN